DRGPLSRLTRATRSLEHLGRDPLPYVAPARSGIRPAVGGNRHADDDARAEAGALRVRRRRTRTDASHGGADRSGSALPARLGTCRGRGPGKTPASAPAGRRDARETDARERRFGVFCTPVPDRAGFMMIAYNRLRSWP